MVTEQSNWSDSKTSNQSLGTEEFKNSINGTYRIIYHRTQKQLRRKNNNFIPLAIKPNPLILKQSSSTTITKVSPLANPSPAPERISGYQPRLSFNREVSDPIKLPPLNPVSVSNRSKLKTDVKDEASRTKPRSIEQRAVTDTDASGANINLKRINVRSKSIHKSNQQVSKTCSIIWMTFNDDVRLHVLLASRAASSHRILSKPNRNKFHSIRCKSHYYTSQ